MKNFFQLCYIFLFLTIGIMACEDDLQPQPEPQPQNKLEAKAGADQQVVRGTLVSLDGSASKDGNGKSFTFAWTLKSLPNGSTVSLQEASTANATFTPDVAGTYVVELKISNALGFATDEVNITATPNQDPEPNEPTPVIISEHITEDLVLEDIFTDGALADYVVTSDITVSAMLTVKPGVRIEFEQDKGLTIYPEGTLIAKGENDGTGSLNRQIIFTGRSYSRGFWKGILLISNSPLNELEYVSVEYAGSSSFSEMPSQIKAGLALAGSNISGSAVKVSHSLFNNGAGYGIYVNGMSELNGFENNYFENNASAAMYVPSRQLHRLDFFSHFTGNNGFNGVETGGSVMHNDEVNWPAFVDGSAYLVSNDITLESGISIQEGATLEFKEGLVLRVINGAYLNATGTAAAKVRFTAHSKTPDRYWGGILIHSFSEKNKLVYAEVLYAGNRLVPNYGGQKANVVITTNGKVLMENSVLKHGLGWGLLGYTDKGAQVNANVNEINIFEDFLSGNTKLTSGELTIQQLEGEWLDQESFNNNRIIDDKFYDQSSDNWFRGAGRPEEMNPRAGLGLRIDGTGNYLWTIAEAGPFAGCGAPYSAEYIKGRVSVSGNQLQFQESYWRSMFYNPCDESQSVDTNVTPGTQIFTYTLEQVYDMETGAPLFRELKLVMPDGSVIKYYKR